MDPKILRKLLGRAHGCLTAALAAIDAGMPEHADVSVRAAYDLLAYVETKRALGAAPTLSSQPSALSSFTRHD